MQEVSGAGKRQVPLQRLHGSTARCRPHAASPVHVQDIGAANPARIFAETP